MRSYVPGKLAEMGLGYEDCKRLNPRLIYASITGQSQAYATGPASMRSRPLMLMLMPLPLCLLLC